MQVLPKSLVHLEFLPGRGGALHLAAIPVLIRLARYAHNQTYLPAAFCLDAGFRRRGNRAITIYFGASAGIAVPHRTRVR